MNVSVDPKDGMIYLINVEMFYKYYITVILIKKVPRRPTLTTFTTLEKPTKIKTQRKVWVQ